MDEKRAQAIRAVMDAIHARSDQGRANEAARLQQLRSQGVLRDQPPRSAPESAFGKRTGD